MSNKEMLNDKEIDHPEATLKFISAMSDEPFIEEIIPQVKEWVKVGEKSHGKI